MGTTRDAINAGSAAFKYVVAIEGYTYLLTDAEPEAAALAWAGTDWGPVEEDPTVRALGGLFVELDMTQRLHPWEPFQGGGSCMLRVVPSGGADTFGIDTHKRASGFQTELTATADRDDTTLNVKTTGSEASAGTLFIGSECIVYTGKTSTTFTGCTRGVYSPFASGAGGRFGQHHRVVTVANGPTIQPAVTAQRRHWAGAWVAVYMHRVVNGVLDVKAEAELVYAGRIAAIGDDPSTGATTVELKHALDILNEFTVGRDMWAARGTGSVLLVADDEPIARCKDYNGTNEVTGTPLTVIATGGTPVDGTEIVEGAYTYSELCAALTDWLADAGLQGEYEFGPGPEPSAGGEDRTKIRWKFPTGSGTCWWRFALPWFVVNFLGFRKSVTGFDEGDILSDSGGATGTGGGQNFFVAIDPPATSLFGSNTGTAPVRIRASLTNVTGTFVDNYDFLPEGIKASADAITSITPDGWGVFLVDNRLFYLGTFVEVASIRYLEFYAELKNLGESRRSYYLDTIPTGEDVEIRQVYIISGQLATLWRQFMYSTGTASHNGSNDVFPFGIGVSFPGGILSGLNASLSTIPGADSQQLVVVDEPTKISELFHGEFLLRGTFPRWKNGSLELAAWSSPLASAAVATLGEENKAAPVGNSEDHRSASLESNEWAKSVVKLNYSRDASDVNDNYAATFRLEDAAAIDDAGGEAAPVTVALRNTYDQYAEQGAAVEQLIPALLARFPLLSRPMRRLTRSIDQRYWLSLSVGDVVLVSDLYARDPDTGERGISSRTALVIRHRWSPGGSTPGSDQPNSMGGEVDLMLTDAVTESPYVPSALVDETQTNAGYNAGTQVLTCYAHKYSESSEDADASHFPATTKIRIIEVDPADPDAPLSWERVVSSQTGNTITHDGSALSGWDNTKRYRIVWQDYDDATSTQQGFAYQADDADGRIQDLANPRRYVFAAGDDGTTAAAVTDPIELIPSAAYGDGRGRDVGHEMALARLANGLLDRKLTRCSPHMTTTVMSSPSVGSTAYGMVYCTPLWLTRENQTSSAKRLLSVAPYMRSATGGSTARVRVSLCRARPSSATLTNVDRGTFVSMTFSTTSATWAVASNLTASLAGVKASDGFVWLVIETNQHAQTYGLAYCQEGERQ